ncbi:uncharacterized protein ACRADG_007331 [Cochliomyia hominivorax]
MNLTALLNFESMGYKGAQTQSKALNMFVANSIRVIIEDFFLKMAPSFIIVVSCRRNSPLNFYLNIMQYLFTMVDNMIVQLVFVDYLKPQHLLGTRMYNLLLVDSLEAFLDIDVISYTRNYDTNEFYHIFLMQRDRVLFKDMKGIFDYCWSNQIINCNVQFQNALGEVYTYTYFPFTPNKCGNTDPQRINQFINDSWVNSKLFHQKLRNFYGCSLVIMVRDIAPYLYKNKDKNGVLTFEGFEMEVMKHLSKGMNFSMDIRNNLRDDRSFPIASGALKMISEGTADIALGFYRKRAEAIYFTTTVPHYQNNMVNIIYLPAHKLNTFEVLFYPFPTYIWYAIGVSVIVMLSITRLFRIGRNKSISTFSMIACAFGSAIRETPKVPHSFLMFTTWLWFTLLIRTLYSGLLFHLFRHEIHSPLPVTLDDTVADGYRPVMNRFTYEDIKYIPFIQRATNHSAIILDSLDEFRPLSYLEQNVEENLYAIVSQEIVIYYIEIFHKPGLFYSIPQNLMQQQLCLYLAKHSYLSVKFNEEIMNVHAVGLVQFWAKNYINNKCDISKHLIPDVKIEQDNLWGIYMICGLLYLVAFLIFLIEMLSLKLKILRKLFE